MHHGTCVAHVSWCMSGSQTRGGGKNVPGISEHAQPTILRIWQEAHFPNLWWHSLSIPYGFNGQQLHIARGMVEVISYEFICMLGNLTSHGDQVCDQQQRIHPRYHCMEYFSSNVNDYSVWWSVCQFNCKRMLFHLTISVIHLSMTVPYND